MSVSILVVDDDPVIRQVVSRHLTLTGNQVAVAVDGVTALEAIDRQRFDLVVTDLQMPRMDGNELLIHLRRDHPLIRTIVMTSYVSLDAIMSCLRQGAFSFVTKPLGDCTELDRCVAQASAVVADWRSQLVKLQRLKQGA
jgi:CheY-like chemotaxis protein